MRLFFQKSIHLSIILSLCGEGANYVAPKQRAAALSPRCPSLLGMLLRRTARSLSSRAAESSRPAGPPGASSFLAYRRRVPGKKKAGKALQVLPPLGGRVSVHMMASIHDSADLVDTLRARFPSGVVQRESPCAALCCVAAAHTRCLVCLAGLSSPTLDGLEELTRADSAADDSLHDVVHLSVPAVGERSPPDAPLASVFFFAGSAQELGACGHTCVSVWWGADPSFEQALLLDLRALHQLSKGPLPQKQQLERLAISREEILCVAWLGLGLGLGVRVSPKRSNPRTTRAAATGGPTPTLNPIPNPNQVRAGRAHRAQPRSHRARGTRRRGRRRGAAAR